MPRDAARYPEMRFYIFIYQVSGDLKDLPISNSMKWIYN